MPNVHHNISSLPARFTPKSSMHHRFVEKNSYHHDEQEKAGRYKHGHQQDQGL
jgi:hypothetical protein